MRPRAQAAAALLARDSVCVCVCVVWGGYDGRVRAAGPQVRPGSATGCRDCRHAAGAGACRRVGAMFGQHPPSERHRQKPSAQDQTRVHDAISCFVTHVFIYMYPRTVHAGERIQTVFRSCPLAAQGQKPGWAPSVMHQQQSPGLTAHSHLAVTAGRAGSQKYSEKGDTRSMVHTAKTRSTPACAPAAWPARPHMQGSTTLPSLCSSTLPEQRERPYIAMGTHAHPNGTLASGDATRGQP